MFDWISVLGMVVGFGCLAWAFGGSYIYGKRARGGKKQPAAGRGNAAFYGMITNIDENMGRLV